MTINGSRGPETRVVEANAHGTGGILLGAADPPAVTLFNSHGRSPFLLLGDHAGNAIPAALGTLGLTGSDRTRHIAWDIGVAALGQALAQDLDATFVAQTYSRLVIDCNRDPSSLDAVPVVSDHSPIPGNVAIDPVARSARVKEIHEVYQQAIATEIEQRDEEGRETIIVSLHSFTPEMNGVTRPWDAGVLHDGGKDGFAHRTLASLKRRPDLVIGDNEPYTMDTTDFTVPRHAAGTRSYVELEIAQNRLQTPADIGYWCALLTEVLRASV